MTLTGSSDTGWRKGVHPRVSRLFAALAVAFSLLVLSPVVSADDSELLLAAGLGAPSAPLTTAADGHRYGVTADGGPVVPGGLPAVASGTVFRIAPNDAVTVLHVFSINDPENGWGPAAALVEGPDGNLYGTTRHGGTHCAHCGTIFRVTPDGGFTHLHSFNGTDGAAPSNAMIVGSDDRLHGATDGSVSGIATLFAITTDGQFELLRSETVASGLATTQTLAGEMLATVQTFDPDVFPGPDTALLDDFNRADSNDLGPDWTVLPANYGFGPSDVDGIQGSAIIVSKPEIDTPYVSGRVQGSNDVNGGNYWNSTFDADQEVYGFFFNSEYNSFGLLVRYDPDTGNGYAIDYNGDLDLYRVVNNEFQSSLLPQPINISFSNDSDNDFLRPYIWLGLRAAGNTLSVWTSDDGTEWTRVLQVTDDQVQGEGHVGFHLHHRFQFFDNIHAGSLDIPPPAPPGGGGGGGGDDGDGSGDGDGGDGNDDGGSAPDIIVDDPVSRPTGSPGGGRQGGIGLGATGLEALALLLLLWGRTTASLCSARISGRKSR